MATVFDDIPVETQRRTAFDDIPSQSQPVSPVRRGFLSGAEGMTQAEMESSAREMEQPLLSLSPAVKQGIGSAALAVLSPLTLLATQRTDTGRKIAKGVGESIGGLIESATSPAGAATLATALMRPAEVVPILVTQGVKQGSEELAEGVGSGDIAKMAQGVTTLGVSVAPLAEVAIKPSSKPSQSTRGATPAPETPFLADFLPHENAKTIFSQPFGAGNIPILGRLVDPNARVSPGPLHESLAAYHAEKHGVGPAVAGNVGLQLRARKIDEAFPVNPKTGELTTVQPAVAGQSLHPSDVLESLQRDPSSYVLTEPQKAAFAELEKWRGEVQALEQKYGIAPEEVSDGYFPRVVIGRPPEDVAAPTGGARVGSKQGFQKGRIFEQSERQGVERGYVYEPSIVSRAVTRTEQLYRAIADKRLADDPSLGSRTRKQVESELREAYSEELGAGTMTEHKLQQIVSSVEHKGTVWGQPGFVGKIFDPETANALNKAFPSAESSFRHSFVQVNNALKAMRLSADVGVAFLQGLPTMFRNPVIWGKAAYNSLKALGDKSVLPKYAAQNAEVINQLVQHGSTVGRLPEMLAGLEKGNFVERFPVAGVAFRAFGRQFETFLDVAKVELWKAWRKVTPPDEILPTIRAIESQLSLGRMESIGVSRNRALAERALLLAPSYYRGAVNLIGAIGERGVAGKIARQAITAYAAGGAATFYGLAQALGMDEETIKIRLNPADPNFLMWQVEVNGRNLNIGFGGIHRSLLRLLANMTVTSIEHPENWAKLTPSKNPLVRWYRGHAASVPGITWDAITGRDFLGQESDLTTVGQSVIPMAAQPLIKGTKETVGAEVGASLIGLSAYPER